MKKKLYIGCALTNLTPEKRPEFLGMLATIKEKLQDHFEIIEFLGKTDVIDAPPLEVYNFDIKDCVMQVDCMLAICDFPSLGTGYELATAVEVRGIPVLAVAHKDSIVSRLVRGIDHKNYQFYYYDTVDDIINKTLETLTR